MKRDTKQSTKKERGQALLLVVVALSLFLLGGFGLAIDGSQLYAQRQMTQAAADAAAQAGIMSVFDKTNSVADSNNFGGASVTCASGSTLTPCYYARLNKFGPEYGDTVQVDFPTSATGVTSLATDFSPNLISVTITRTVQTGLLQFLGPSSHTVVGHATAAILLPPVPIPIIVTHPTLAAAFQMSSGQIKITNGPLTSIQVNSCAGKGGNGTNGLPCASGLAATSSGGNGTCSNTCVDLSAAGPDGGAGRIGNWGEPSTWAGTGNGYLKPSGTYLEPSSALTDPLTAIAAPTTAGRPVITTVTPTLTNVAPNPCIVNVTTTGGLPATPSACQGTNTYGCPGSASTPPNSKGLCYLFYPGVYPGPISVGGGNWAIFAPGLYYIPSGDGNNTGFQLSPANASMATGLASNAETGTGMTIYLTGSAVVNIQGGSNVNLLGDTVNTTFGGMLFFKDRTDTCSAHSGICNHHLSGGSGMSLTGTMYMTKGLSATNSIYNILNIAASGSTTNLAGEIIVDTLNVNGNAEILMNLTGAFRDVHQVALVQ